MLQFEEVHSAKIRCGLPKGKPARVDFAFPLGWVPYVCCGESVIHLASFSDLKDHIQLLVTLPDAVAHFCRFFDPEQIRCTHEATRIEPAKANP